MMGKQRIGSVIQVLVIAVGLAAAFWLGIRSVSHDRHSVVTEAATKIRIAPASETVVAGLLGVGSVSQNSEQGLSAPLEGQREFSQDLQACVHEQTNLDMNDFVNSLIDQNALHRELQYENYHFHLKNGSERRIQIRPGEGEIKSDKLQLKLFSVDAEGLPIPEEVPKSLQGLPLSLQMLAFSESREPLFSEKKELVQLKDQQNLMVLWQQGRIFEFHWTASDFSFACQNSQCKCLLPRPN